MKLIFSHLSLVLFLFLAHCGGGGGAGSSPVPGDDFDVDTVLNASDNCLDVANPDQKDKDGDGIGDECDNDLDGDTVSNDVDNCQQTPNPNQEDANGDGQGDACEHAPIFGGHRPPLGNPARANPNQRGNPNFNPNPNPGANPEPANPVPYFDALVAAEKRDLYREKYRPVFTSDKLLSTMKLDGITPFPDWDEALKRKLINTLVFYEEVQGERLPPFEGNCSPQGGENSCYRVDMFRVPYTVFTPEYREYLQLTQMAWNLYVEANHLLPWSILGYSEESLALLFRFPEKQYYGTQLDVTETFRIVKGTLREAQDHHLNLVGATALETLLNTTQFVGERIKHIRGTDQNTTGPSHPIWPYRARNAEGEPLYDPQGIRVPLNRHPTPKEVLVYRDPHHDLVIHPDAPLQAQYHIVNGCWGASALLKDLFHSMNLPVELLGDYHGFGGHSGVRFAEIEGHNYYLHHLDNLYYFPWLYGVLQKKESIAVTEHWSLEGFFPFQNVAQGYSVFHTDFDPFLTAEKLAEFGLEGERLALVQGQLPEVVGDFLAFDKRLLALRSLIHPSTQSLYGRCETPNLAARFLPLSSLTDEEERDHIAALDRIIGERRQQRPAASCFELFYDELNVIYKAKTGLELNGDADGDGVLNYRDCHIYAPAVQVCEASFYNSVGL